MYMKLIIDLPDELLEQIHRVNPTVSILTFIKMAVENQLHLETETNSYYFEKFSDINSQGNKKFRELHTPVKLKKSKESVKVRQGNDIIPAFDFNKIHPIELKYPIKDTIIWGQYNKFFPIKFGLRFLCYKLSNSKESTINLNEFQIECSKKASYMKEILESIDKKENRKRGEKFSAGLPDNNEKSQYRYISHFLGFRTSKGDPVGGIPTLGFAEFSNSNVGITRYGLEFAKIENPIMDISTNSDALMSKEEQEYLLHHIKQHLPQEAKIIKLVLKSISEKKNTPDSINIELSKFEGIGEKANTIRTGILARSHDLGLIERENIGIHSFYKITNFGIDVRDSL